MHPAIDRIFNEAEQRYLNSDELGVLTQYVDSLDDRLNLYRQLRDQEIRLLQPVADQLQQAFPQTDQSLLERVIKNGILALRSCGMAMLLQDESYVQERIAWLQQAQTNYDCQALDGAFYRLLEQQLQHSLTPQQMSLLQDSIHQVRQALSGSISSPNLGTAGDEELSAASLF